MQRTTEGRALKTNQERFALKPLPIFQDIPRPLKSLEVASDPMASGFPFDDKLITKEVFKSCLESELSNRGVQDDTGRILQTLLIMCAKDGLYTCPSHEMLEGIKIGWTYKPITPPVNEAFEHHLTDFHNEILRMMRASEERCKRLIVSSSMAKGKEILTDNILSGEAQLARLQDDNHIQMAWVICYATAITDVPTFFSSKSWCDLVATLFKKGWGTWATKVHTAHGANPSKVIELGNAARKNLLTLPSLKEGKVLVDDIKKRRYNDESGFYTAIEEMKTRLEKNHGKKT